MKIYNTILTIVVVCFTSNEILAQNSHNNLVELSSDYDKYNK
jgi:hypothetical protein